MGHACAIIGLNVCPPSTGWRNQSQHAIITGAGNNMALPLAVIAGVPASAGLAFMLAGSVTSISAAIAIFSLAKTRLFAPCFAVGGAGALLTGLTSQLAG